MRKIHPRYYSIDPEHSKDFFKYLIDEGFSTREERYPKEEIISIEQDSCQLGVVGPSNHLFIMHSEPGSVRLESLVDKFINSIKKMNKEIWFGNNSNFLGVHQVQARLDYIGNEKGNLNRESIKYEVGIIEDFIQAMPDENMRENYQRKLDGLNI